jgi:hypothetical protein
VAEQGLYVVEVTDVLVPALVGQAGCRYRSPVQDEEQARLLIRVLLGLAQNPSGTGPWRWPMAGGRRYIALRRLGECPAEAGLSAGCSRS